MIRTKDILDESNPILRKENIDVEFPLDKETKKTINDMLEHLYYSQIEEYSEKYDLRPGMGLAAPQIGINKRFFVVCHEETENNFKNYILINPKMISHSEELIYAEEGEGCLSVNREVDGIVPRYARVTFTGYDLDGNLIKYRAREELSIAFQHEMDHLNGILFIDHIDPKNPYKNKEYMREI
jgi:peptide deformylase